MVPWTVAAVGSVLFAILTAHRSHNQSAAKKQHHRLVASPGDWNVQVQTALAKAGTGLAQRSHGCTLSITCNAVNSSRRCEAVTFASCRRDCQRDCQGNRQCNLQVCAPWTATLFLRNFTTGTDLRPNSSLFATAASEVGQVSVQSNSVDRFGNHSNTLSFQHITRLPAWCKG